MADPQQPSPVPPAGPIPGGAVGPTSYAQYYSVAANDPHGGDPTAIFHAERAALDDANDVRPTPASILEAMSSDPNPDAYLGFEQRATAPPTTYVLLRATKVPHTRGINASIFGGDIIA